MCSRNVGANTGAPRGSSTTMPLMRALVDPDKIRQLMREIGRRSRGPGRVYLVGGASALLEGWRSTTVDVDLKKIVKDAVMSVLVA